LGPLGTAWGDPGVEAAAKLADLLQPVWSDLRLRRIRVLNPIGNNGVADVVLEVTTRSGTAFIWGPSPGNETSQEPKAAEKLARLQQLASKQGSLDSTPNNQRDLRRLAAAPIAETPKAELKQ
jgi:hypothetical protein